MICHLHVDKNLHGPLGRRLCFSPL